jgi:hypothetical protein
MKKVFLFLGAIMISGVTLLTSCTEENPADTPPTVSFVAGAGFISDDATLTVNTPFEVKILAEANATSGSKISSLKVTRVFGLQSSDTTYSGFNDATLTMTISFPGVSQTGDENIEFKVTDKDGFSSTISLLITWETAAGGPIDTWEMRILGSWNNADTGSSFASINGNVYKLNEAFVNQPLIDFMYWWAESTHSATLGAPNDTNAAKVFNTGAYKLENWTTLNSTKFKTTTVSSAAFDAITDATDCIDIATGADLTRIANLDPGEVIAFVTVTNKHGLIRVKSKVDGSSGSITIDIKVEQ